MTFRDFIKINPWKIALTLLLAGFGSWVFMDFAFTYSYSASIWHWIFFSPMIAAFHLIDSPNFLLIILLFLVNLLYLYLFSCILFFIIIKIGELFNKK